MVTHILKDGTKRKEIKGHIVKECYARPLYALINRKEQRVDNLPRHQKGE